ncbi:FtsK/SpoIIIE domain-containing protein [Rothia sp. 32237D007AR]
MKLLLRIQQPPAGPYRSVELEYSRGTTGAICHQELCSLWGSDHFSWSIQGNDIRGLTPGLSPWVDGAQLKVSGSLSHPIWSSPSESQPLFILRVIHGPDSHSYFPLARGSWEIGRQASLLRVEDPSLAPIEGCLEVTGSGVYFSGKDAHHRITIGEKFVLGSSVLVLDQHEKSPPLFCDPEIQEIDVPAPKSKLLTVAMMIFPLIIGLVIAWFTKLWFILLMACGSSLLMGLHAFTQGHERSSVRREIAHLAHAEEEAVVSYRGADAVHATTGFIVGRGTRPLRVMGRQRELEQLPEVQAAPYTVNAEELAQILPTLPLSAQRLALYQLVAKEEPVYVLVGKKDPAWFLRLIDPLLATANVLAVSTAELDSVDAGVVVCCSIPASLPAQLRAFPVSSYSSPQSPTDLFSPPHPWHSFVVDGISEERYCALLADLTPGQLSPISQGLAGAKVLTSHIPAYGLTELPQEGAHKNLWAAEIFLFAGQACGSNANLQLGLTLHGPHFLCAGTTGSGKSQLLRSLLWSAALRYPPQRLSLILIDFKGGAGLGPLASLPHCASLISDLETSQLMRTMKFLRADLTRRKQMWKRMGISSYDDYIACCKATRTAPEFSELVICIDEFRMLVDDYPEIMNEIMKIATIGRSLGYHLILATQRPQGAISPDIRANISTLMCLRVSSAQESFSVLGSDDAAHLSAQSPGRGLLKSTENEVVEFQAPLITGLYEQEPEDLCRARFILDIDDSHMAKMLPPLSDTDLEATNTSVHQAYQALHQLPAYRPIAAALQPPKHTDMPDSAHPFSLLLGRYEIAELGLQAPFIWTPSNGPVLLQGSSNDCLPALQVTLLQALEKGYAVLCLTPSEQRAREIRGWGEEYAEQVEVFTYQDFDYVQHLLASCAEDPKPGQLLLIDALEVLLDSLQRHPVAEFHLQQILTMGEHPKVQVLCTSVTGVRGKYQQIFEHTFMTRSALESDPLRPHTKDYTIPGSGQFAVEGKSIYDSSQGRVQAGTLVWAALDTSPSSSDKASLQPTTQLEGSYPGEHSWRPLPLFCPVHAISRAPKPHSGALACGVLRDGSTAFTPPLRAGFMSVSGPRGSGKTSLLQTFIQANPEYYFILISSGATTQMADIEQALLAGESLGVRPILLIDNLDQLSHDVQHTILNQKDKFESVVLTYTPWPRWNTSPILAALNGTSTGIVLSPRTSADMSFYPGLTLPLDLRTYGQLPAGRGVIIDHARVSAFQAALPEVEASGKKESDTRE